MNALKRIFAYLKCSHDCGLFYSKNNDLSLKAYTNADFEVSKTNRKSTSGSCQFLGHLLISWFSKK